MLRHSIYIAAVLCASSYADQPTTPVITKVSVNYTANTLTVTGTNLTSTKSAPDINFNNSVLTVTSWTNEQAVAALPGASSIAAGTYQLIVTDSGNTKSPTIFDLTLGAAGPVGPQGLTGPAGAQGAVGPVGQTGPVGPAGPTGLNWRGSWSSTVPYRVNDAVFYEGTSYVATASSLGFNPNEFSTTVWNRLAQGLNWLGAWSSSTTYYLNDSVSYRGSTYISLSGYLYSSPNTGNEPDTSPINWGLLASIGGVGPQGPIGPAGTAGARGPIGLTGPAGTTGPQGPAGPTGQAGVPGANGIGINWRGSWSSSATYSVNDAVSFGGQSYIATTTGQNFEPDVNTGAWGLLAVMGASSPITNWRGAWNSANQYCTGDAVQYNGSTYLNITTIGPPQGYRTGGPGCAANYPPDGNSGLWSLLASAGSAGPPGAMGPAGAAGATGPQGLVGPVGPQGTVGVPGPIGLTGPAGAQGVNGAVGQSGSAGPQGPAGAAGTNGIGVNWRGAWSSSVTYSVNDAVSFGGQSYIATTSGQNFEPDVNTGTWGLLATMGASSPIINWRGAWNSANQYCTGDAVQYNGSTYLNITTIGPPQGYRAGTPGCAANYPPDGNSGLWSLLASAGSAGPMGATGQTGSAGPIGLTGPAGGTGPQGSQGAPGPTGATGPQGPQGLSNVFQFPASDIVVGSATADQHMFDLPQGTWIIYGKGWAHNETGTAGTATCTIQGFANSYNNPPAVGIDSVSFTLAAASNSTIPTVAGAFAFTGGVTVLSATTMYMHLFCSVTNTTFTFENLNILAVQVAGQ